MSSLYSREKRMTRKEGAGALTDVGFPTSEATLATKASRGGGPPYELWGRRPLYRWGDLIDWAEKRLSSPVGSTSEAAASQPAPTPRIRRASHGAE